MGDRKKILISVLFLSGLTCLFLCAVNFTVDNDNGLSLILSQTLLEKHSFKLDGYYDGTYDGHHFNRNFYGKTQVNGHFYEFYPPGTAIFSMPVVCAARKLGMDMTDRSDRYVVSNLCAILLNAMIFFVLFRTGRYFVSEKAAFVITAVSFLGSSLTSTLGAALTSHQYVVLFSALVVFLLVREESGRGNALAPYIIGTLLFCCFLSRSASASFILTAMVYLYFKDRKFFLKTSIVSSLLLLIFVLFSFFEYGKALPPYYHAFGGAFVGRQTEYSGGRNDGFLTALYGILLSPSRGIFVFSPFLLVIAAGTIFAFNRFKGDGLFRLCIGWILTSTLMISNWFSWEGGHSFGPRLFVDSLPSLVLLSFLLYGRIGQIDSGRLFKRLAIAAYALSGVFAIWVNSYQGLYNEWVVMWNKIPPLGDNVKKFVLDWRYPQFLADADDIKGRIVDYCGENLSLCDDEFHKKILTRKGEGQ